MRRLLWPMNATIAQKRQKTDIPVRFGVIIKPDFCFPSDTVLSEHTIQPEKIPIPAPSATSDSQCWSLYMRAYEVDAAATYSNDDAHHLLILMESTVLTVKATALCPDGSDMWSLDTSNHWKSYAPRLRYGRERPNAHFIPVTNIPESSKDSPRYRPVVRNSGSSNINPDA